MIAKEIKLGKHFVNSKQRCIFTLSNKQIDTLIMEQAQNKEKKVTLNANVATTSVTQTGNEVLGTKEKNLYYLIIKNDKGEKLIINVGQKTHDEVQKLTNG